MRGSGTAVAAAVIFVGGLGATTATAAKPDKYIVIVKGVREAPGVKLEAGLLDEARKALLAEVPRHAELTLERPADLPADPDQLGAALRARKLKAMELRLTIVGVTQEVRPPPAGKRFRTLLRGIRLTVTGETVPEWLVNLTGDGTAEAGAEISAQADLDREGRKLIVEAAGAAIAQALDETVNKLRHPPPGPRARKHK